MALSDFEFKSSYNKVDHHIAEEFYIPCMRNSTHYDRITGYFSSAIYTITWNALKEFINSNGHIRIICSPMVSEDDASAILEGNEAKINEILLSSLSGELERMFSKSFLQKPSRLLACLISNGTIDIKLAVPREFTHPSVKQLFHDKVGIFYDDEGNKVGFRGSLNETYSGLSIDGNIESIDVFQSWDGGKEEKRTEEAADFFNRVWENKILSVTLYELPEEIKKVITSKSKNDNWEKLLNEVNEDLIKSSKWLKENSEKDLRYHQSLALENWEKNHYRGIFEHATGSGKTFTAMCAIRNALKRNKSIIILVPSIGLLTQWESELREELTDLNVKYLICGTGFTIWKNNNVLYSWTSPTDSENTIVLTTMDTAYGDFFMENVNQGDHLLIVADEVHRIGSTRRRRFLKIESGERLGLSATPIRYGDPEGTEVIFNYFGGIVDPVYTLRDAISDNVLTKYFYYPKTLKLTDTEQTDWNDLTKQINILCARLISKYGEDYNCMNNPKTKSLVLNRARIIKNASEKIELALDIIKNNYQPGQKWIVYCDNQTQLTSVLNVLIKNGYNAYEFHSEMIGDRTETLDYFSCFGGILVSIRCLDEGIDIPSTTHALILASSKNPREYIQRRGRILRKSPGKNFAYLFDAVVVPDNSLEQDISTTSIIESELARSIQFGSWAENPSCIADIKNIAIDFNVDVEKISQGGFDVDDEE